jgi:hypothetical protein
MLCGKCSAEFAFGVIDPPLCADGVCHTVQIVSLPASTGKSFSSFLFRMIDFFFDCFLSFASDDEVATPLGKLLEFDVFFAVTFI